MAPDLIVITGPTASGKTEVALRAAQAHGGEIVCADSRTVYRGLDIGTAKPTRDERARVAHYLLDVADPDEPYDLARFQRDARAAIDDIRARDKLPILVGGSGLYVDSVVLDYELASPPDPKRRAELEAMPYDALLRYSKTNNIELPNNSHNKRYVIRAIEQGGVNRKRTIKPAPETVVIGITTDTEVLKKRIYDRAERLFTTGLVGEAVAMSEKYGWEIPPLRAPAYDAVRRFLCNGLPRDEAVEAFARADWQLARKQLTWFRRNDWINWVPLDAVEHHIDSRLAGRGTIRVE